MQLSAFFISLIFVATATSDTFYECLPGMTGPGVSLPKGDIELLVGSNSIEIFCHLNPDYSYFKNEGARATDLSFYKISTKSGSSPEKMNSSILNDTSISAFYDPDTVAKDRIECRVNVNGNTKGVCNQIVYVGHPALPPENFTCISDNWQSLNCTWDVPYNPIPTEYTLYYMEKGNGGRQYKCPSTGGNNCLVWREPLYRKLWETYPFFMTANNSLESTLKITYLPIEQFKFVRPKAPIIDVLESQGPRRIELKYTIDHNLHLFPPGLRQDAQYKSEYDAEWTQLPIDNIDTQNDISDVHWNITGLHPYTLYTIRIRMCSVKANCLDQPQLWSPFVEKTVRTIADIPEKAPQTCLGSFELVTHDIQRRDIFVYWSKIADKFQNGPDFNYVITEVFEAGKPVPKIPKLVTNAYAKFTQLRLSNYTFVVTSKNANGTAKDTSKLFVPDNDQVRKLQPKSFTKIAYSDQLFELSWLPPDNDEPIVSYTVFWCLSENNRDRPYQCEGQLSWKTVPRSNSSLNVTVPTENVYQFAVAANTPTYSTGMIWATCTILHNKVVGKLKTVTVDVVKKDSMLVRWRLDCTDRIGIVSGYKVVYCPIHSHDDTSECIDGKYLVEETSEDHAIISNLQPWTIYKVAVSVVTKAGEGELSDYLVNRTLPSRPGGPPENIQISKRHNTTNKVHLIWNPPLKPNGPIKMYQIRYGYVNHKGDLEWQIRETENNATFDKLSDLAFFAEYDFKIRACGQMPDSADPVCGDWGAQKFTTGIGPSGSMPPPIVTFVNATEVKVVWDLDSFHHGGPIDHFELKVCSQWTEACHRSLTKDKTETKLMLDQVKEDLSPDCYNASVTNMFNFTIRSVTFDAKTDQKFSSPWSQVEVVPAYCRDETPIVMLGIVILVVVVIGILLTFYFFRCYKWGHDTNNIFKDVDNEIEVAYKEAIPVEKVATSNNTVKNTHLPNSCDNHKVDWTEMNDMSSPQSGKHPSYQRAGSKDSMEILLDNKGKVMNERGTSESTSGCESGQNYESDDLEVPKSQSNSSENVSKEEESETETEERIQPGLTSNYSQISGATNFWQPVRRISDSQTPHNDGYTRAAVILPPISTSLENLRPPISLQEPSSYVTLQSPSIPPVSATPKNNGYITVDEANKMLFKQNAERAYSKVAIAPISNQIVMSAKDLQVESKPPFRKVVTSLEEANSTTKSTMV